MTRHVTHDPSANVLPMPILAELIARKRLRRKIERTVTKLIAALDALESDPDVEPEEDADATADDPRGELDTADAEPSLGAPERGLWYSQASWSTGGDRDEREVTCEDEGADIQAVPHDEEPDEPSLSARTAVWDQRLGWSGNDGGYNVTDGEADPSDREPWLGAVQHVDQRDWGSGDTSDRELVNEDGGDVRDVRDSGENPDEFARQRAALARNDALMALLPPVSPDLLQRIVTDGTLYAMHLVGDCMTPLIPHGTKVVINPRARVRAGDLVCFYHQSTTGIVAKVKRLGVNLMPGITLPVRGREGVDDCVPALIVETLNPPQVLMIDCRRVFAVHKVVGTLSAAKKLNTGLVRRNRADLKRSDRLA